MHSIGERIFLLRKKRCISQEALADRINVSRQAISKWENDTTQPNAENIQALCEQLSVTPDYFYDEHVNIANEIAATDATNRKKGIKLYVTLIVITSLLIIVLGFLSYWFGCIAFTPNVGDVFDNDFDIFQSLFTCGIVLLSIFLLFEILLIIVIFKRCKHNANIMQL